MAYLLESEFGIELPKDMQREFGPIANDEVDRLGREVSGAELKEDVLAGIHRAYYAVVAEELSRPRAKTEVVKCRAKLFRDGNAE